MCLSIITSRWLCSNSAKAAVNSAVRPDRSWKLSWLNGSGNSPRGVGRRRRRWSIATFRETRESQAENGTEPCSKLPITVISFRKTS